MSSLSSDVGRLTTLLDRFEARFETSVDEIAEGLPLWQRIKAVVQGGPQTLTAIASELSGEKVESIDRTVRRYNKLFTKVTSHDGVTRIALVERRAS